MSSASSAEAAAAVAAFAAGRESAERMAAAVAAAYYAASPREREALQPLMAVLERAAPGVVELAARGAAPGFGVRPLERPVSGAAVAELRAAAAALLATGWGAGATAPPGLWARLVTAVRRLFSAAP
jgi:hypothetical protein